MKTANIGKQLTKGVFMKVFITGPGPVDFP